MMGTLMRPHRHHGLQGRLDERDQRRATTRWVIVFLAMLLLFITFV